MMKQLIFSFLLFFAAVGIGQAQNEPQDATEMMEQFQKDITEMMQQFEQMPDFSRIWSDTLFFREFHFDEGREYYSDREAPVNSLEEMMKWMERQFDDMEYEGGSMKDLWLRNFEEGSEIRPPLPENLPEIEPREQFPQQPTRKKRKVYSM